MSLHRTMHIDLENDFENWKDKESIGKFYFFHKIAYFILFLFENKFCFSNKFQINFEFRTFLGTSLSFVFQIRHSLISVTLSNNLFLNSAWTPTWWKLLYVINWCNLLQQVKQRRYYTASTHRTWSVRQKNLALHFRSDFLVLGTRKDLSCALPVLDNPVILSLASISDGQNTMIQLCGAAGWLSVDTSLVQLEWPMTCVHGNRDWAHWCHGFLESLLRSPSDISVTFVFGADVGLLEMAHSVL